MRILSLSLRAAALVMTLLAFLLGFMSDFVESTVTADFGQGGTEFAETTTQSAWHQVGILGGIGVAVGLALLVLGAALFVMRHRKRQTVDLMATGTLTGAVVLHGIYFLTLGPSTRGSDNLAVDVSPGGPGVFSLVLLVTSALAVLVAGALPRDDDEFANEDVQLDERSDITPPTV